MGNSSTSSASSGGPGSVKNFVIRGGFGMYYDRGEYFSEFSPSAGSGFNGPFGVTLAPPFVQQVGTTTSAPSPNRSREP